MIQPVKRVRDARNNPVLVCDRVRKVDMVAAYGDKAIVRTVEAVGLDGHLKGYVMVSGLLGWQSAKMFEKVAS